MKNTALNNTSAVISKKAVEGKKNTQKYEMILQTSMDGFCIINRNGEISYVNKSLCSILGYAENELVGMNIKNIATSGKLQKISQLVQQLSKKGHAKFENPMLKKEGNIINTEVSITSSSAECRELLMFVKDNGKRKPTKTTLNISEKEYKEFVENASDVIYSADTTGHFTFANPVTLRISGYSLEELQGFTYLDLVLPEYRSRTKRAYFKQFLKKESPLYVECPFKTKSGKIKWFGQLSSLKIEGDKVLGFQVIARDITERKKAEEALQTSQAQLSNAVEIASLGPWEYNVLEDRFIFNDHFYKIFHTSAKEIGGYTMSSEEYAKHFVHPDDLPLVGKEIQAAIETKDPNFSRQLEHRIIYSDGGIGYVTVRFYIVKNEEGRTIKTYGVNQDITQQKKAIKALEESEKLLLMSQKIAKLGHYTYNTLSGEGEASEEVNEIFGTDKTYMNNLQNWLKIIHPDHKELMSKYFLNEVLGNKNPFNKEYKIIRACDGQTRWVHSRGELVFDKNGEPVQVVGTVHDITNRKKAEAQIEKLNRVYAILSNINQSIVRIRNMKELFKKVCSIAVEKGGFSMAWISLMDESTQKMEIVAYSGKLDFDTFLSMHNILQETELSEFQNTNIFGSPPHHIIKALNLNDDRMKSVKVNNEAKKCRSLGSFPIYTFGKICGSINLSSCEPDFFDEKEVELLDELTMDVSFAMEVNEQENLRRRMEDELRDSEERFRSLYENSTVGIYRTTPQGEILLANPALVKILGYSSFEGLKNRNLSKEGFKTSTERTRFLEKIEKENEVKGIESAWLKRDGGVVYIRESAKAIRNYDGELLHIDGIVEDITEWKKVEDALRKSETQLSNAAEIAQLAPWEYDVENDIFKFTDQFYKVFHTSAEEVGGYTLSSAEYSKRFIHPDDLALANREIQIAMQTTNSNYNGQLEHRTIFANGKIGYMSVRYFIVKDNNGKTIRTFGVNQNITDRKLAEKEIIKAKEHAEEMNRLKSVFLANMSHELRTPLVGMLGLSEFLQEKLTGELRENAEIINESGNRLLHTLSSILDYSRIESGKVETVSERVSLTNLLREETKLYYRLALQKGISLKEQFDRDEIFIQTDERYLRDIIDNLLNNALKFTRNGSITVSQQKTGKEVVISIQDTGIGIPEEKLNIIFEEFRQVSEGKNRGFEGSGLGLAIVKKYVQLLNGRIKVKSKQGEGTTFTIILPTVTTSQENKKNKLNTVSFPNVAGPKKKNNGMFHILLVEDDLITSKTIHTMLNNNYSILPATNGKDAIEAAKQRHYDAILMDINLGIGMNGLETAQEIRNLEGYETTPIVAMTAYAMKGDREEFLEAGCSHYLSKPFTKPEIIKFLTSVLNSQ